MTMGSTKIRSIIWKPAWCYTDSWPHIVLSFYNKLIQLICVPWEDNLYLGPLHAAGHTRFYKLQSQSKKWNRQNHNLINIRQKWTITASSRFDKSGILLKSRTKSNQQWGTVIQQKMCLSRYLDYQHHRDNIITVYCLTLIYLILSLLPHMTHSIWNWIVSIFLYSLIVFFFLWSRTFVISHLQSWIGLSRVSLRICCLDTIKVGF